MEELTSHRESTACYASNSCNNKDGEEKGIRHNGLLLFAPQVLILTVFKTS